MKKVLIKYLPLLGILLLIIIIGYFLTRTGHEGLQQYDFTDIITGEGPSLKDIRYFRNTPDNGSKWELETDEVMFSKDGRHIRFNKFSFKLEASDGVFIEMEGNKGDYDKTSGEINLKGDLKGFIDKGYTIYTEHLFFKQNEGYLRTDEAVKLTGPFFIVTGKGLFVDLKKETLRILSDVNTVIEKGSFGL
jgi:LPS export ABC transporter protein LptC